jgi:O-antigen/teichoic acid export membrane protein
MSATTVPSPAVGAPVSSGSSRLRDLLRLDGASRPTLWLILGRGVGFLAAFVVPLVIVRLFDQATFGTYKQLFLIHATLYIVAQIGMAESLYYFVPRSATDAGRHTLNAVVTLGVMGLVSVATLGLAARPIAASLTNPQLADTLLPLGIFLALMLVSAPFEIVLVSRQRHQAAAGAYAISDIGRAALMLAPALVFGSLRSVLWGAIAFAAVRLGVMLWTFGRTIWATLQPGPSLLREQWAYTVPYALAVVLEVLQGNLHHYVVASRFDPAMFAIYAVGCLQVPLVDVISTSSANVMMVRMGEHGFERTGPAALELWHETTRRLALVLFPLAAFLVVMAEDIIVVMFTSAYLPSVPIFMLWTCTILFAVPSVDAVLRVHAQTRFLFGLNILRLAVVLGLTGWFLTLYGLAGAVLVMLLSTGLARVAGVARVATLLGISLSRVMPWRVLATTALQAAVAAAPTLWFARAATLPRPLVLAGAVLIYGGTYAVLAFGLGREPVKSPSRPAVPDVSP